MAVQLTPPTKNIFYLSVGLGVLSIALYLLGVFGVTGGGFQAVSHYAFWLAVLGWLAMTVGVAQRHLASFPVTLPLTSALGCRGLMPPAGDGQ